LQRRDFPRVAANFQIIFSVDHGTAFGEAGEGRANPESMIQAIKIAVQLAQKGKK
jgi:4-hydroxy-L-threonine phosphate dehydrogenase PdxA